MRSAPCARTPPCAARARLPRAPRSRAAGRPGRSAAECRRPADQASAGSVNRSPSSGLDRAERAGEADAREHLGARDADVGRGRIQRRFGRADVGTALHHATKAAPPAASPRPATSMRCTEIARSTRSCGERPSSTPSAVRALDDFELELMHRHARRRGVRFGALECELVALAGIEAQLLQLQRFLARRQRVAAAQPAARRRRSGRNSRARLRRSG